MHSGWGHFLYAMTPVTSMLQLSRSSLPAHNFCCDWPTWVTWEWEWFGRVEEGDCNPWEYSVCVEESICQFFQTYRGRRKDLFQGWNSWLSWSSGYSWSTSLPFLHLQSLLLSFSLTLPLPPLLPCLPLVISFADMYAVFKPNSTVQTSWGPFLNL